MAGPSQRAADDGSQSGGSGQPGGDANRARDADQRQYTFPGVVWGSPAMPGCPVPVPLLLELRTGM